MKTEFIYKHLRNSITGPTSLEDIQDIFSKEQSVSVDELRNALDKLVRQGQLIKTRANRYGIPEQMNLLTGRVNKVRKGFGFLVTDDIGEEDLYIPAENLNSAQNGDKVIVRIMKPARVSGGKKSRAECEVVRIIERHNKTYVGTYKRRSHYALVVPDNLTFGHDIIVAQDDEFGCQNGDKVLVDITDWGSQTESPEGKIVQRLGKNDEAGIDVLSLVYRYDLAPEFTKEQLNEARRIASQPIGSNLSSRRDFRLYRMVTIDGDDSKDLDDAVSLEILDNGHYLLGVHIADVGEYIKEDSILDKEAFKRGTSVYFVDRVLPMLPTDISNNICSLNANEDRLALSCVMEFNEKGRLQTYEISESIINVADRFSYSTVNQILEEQRYDKDSIYVEMFNEMNQLKELLHQNRVERGALEFEFPESKIILDEHGGVKDIQLYQRGEAERIIEEFMIAANETVAAHFFRARVPFIYRVHEEPGAEKLDNFINFITKMGFHIPKDHDLKTKDFQIIHAEAVKKECADIVDVMMLRSMNHAYYTTTKTSHFSLASRYYTHFTSPIRRYSDLSIHRLIKEYLKNRTLNERRLAHYEKSLIAASEQASRCEHNAEEAERACVDLKKAEFMVPHIGESYVGKIVSVTGFGLFVRIDKNIEGLVHISNLVHDYFFFDQEDMCLIGEHTGMKYGLGQSIEITVSDVNVKEHKIDFVLKEEPKKKRNTKK